MTSKSGWRLIFPKRKCPYCGKIVRFEFRGRAVVFKCGESKREGVKVDAGSEEDG